MEEISHLKNEVKTLFQAVEFISETCSQINKDLFGLSDSVIATDQVKNAANPLDELVDLLKPIIASMIGQGALQQFIYKVDLPEQKFLEVLNQDDQEQLVFMVVRREAQKVFLKRKFR